jgi:hypothetical protein
MSVNTTPVKKDAWGHDSITTYYPLDGLGVNALPDSEK